MADETTKTETADEGTDGGTVEPVDEREHGVPDMIVEPKTLDLGDATDADVDALLADLDLDGGTPDGGDDTGDSGDPQQDEPTAREKELMDKMSEQGRQIKELRQQLQGNQDPPSRRREPTGDPTQDSINTLGDAFVEMDDKLNAQLAQQESVESYLDEGIDRQTAKELAKMEQSNDVEDRIAWRRAYNKATEDVKTARERSIKAQQSRDFVATGESNGNMSGGRSPSTTHSAATVAKKLSEKYPNGRDRMNQVALLEKRFGEDFADEVLEILGR